MTLKSGICPHCNEVIDVDIDKKLGICPHCKKPFYSADTLEDVTKGSSIKESIIDIKEDVYESLIDEANQQLNQHDFAKAEILFKQAIKQQPSQYHAWLGLAQAISDIYQSNDRYAETVFSIEKAISLAPNQMKEKIKHLLETYRKAKKSKKNNEIRKNLWIISKFSIIYVILLVFTSLVVIPYITTLPITYNGIPVFTIVYVLFWITIPIIIYILSRYFAFKSKNAILLPLVIFIIYHFAVNNVFSFLQDLLNGAINLDLIIFIFIQTLVFISEYFFLSKVIFNKNFFKPYQKKLKKKLTLPTDSSL